jgi:hypothetical protein
MKKYKLVLTLAVLLLGAILSGSIVVYLATSAMSNILAGDMLGAEKYPMTHVQQMIDKYNIAQTYWPFLQYNQQFVQRKKDLEKILHLVQSKPAITIFLKTPLNSNNVTLLTKEIQVVPGVTKVSFISQEKAFEMYRQQNKNDKLLLGLVTEGTLPASLEVYVSNQTAKTIIEKLARSKPFVSQVVKSPDY